MIGQQEQAFYARGEYIILYEECKDYERVRQGIENLQIDGKRLESEISPFPDLKIIGVKIPLDQGSSSELEAKVKSALEAIPGVIGVDPVPIRTIKSGEMTQGEHICNT